MRYAIVIENAGTNFSAYVPDLPGCVATGATSAKAERAIAGAIELHLEGMRRDAITDTVTQAAPRTVDRVDPHRVRRPPPDTD
jgi:predicted RNase H-like HicB family nuclease